MYTPGSYLDSSLQQIEANITKVSNIYGTLRYKDT